MANDVDPVILQIPSLLETARLVLRVPQPGDGTVVHRSVLDSLPELKPWMPWAIDDYGAKDAEAFCRRSAGEFHARTRLTYLLMLRNEEHVGTCSLHDIKWDVPRFEIGYWLRTGFTGRGYMTEAVEALVLMAIDKLGAQRLEIRADTENIQSWRVAERCGFTHEGTFARDFRYPDGRLRDTRVYAKVREPKINAGQHSTREG
jgi:RimJ/RimL family protein N-acetyltransferase